MGFQKFGSPEPIEPEQKPKTAVREWTEDDSRQLKEELRDDAYYAEKRKNK